MKAKQLIIFLVLINLAVLFYLVTTAQTKSNTSRSASPIIRARAIELVDDKGQSRALLNVEANGETVFRLRDAKGTIRVKLGATEDGSALLLLNNSTSPGIHALAKSDGSTMTLINNNGRKRVIEP
jgi:hypothetical protein